MFAGIQVGQHVLLDAANRGAGHLELAAPASGQLGRQGPAGGGLCRADNESLAFEGLQEHIHRLPGDEGAAGKLRVRQARSLGKQLQAGVVDRFVVLTTHYMQEAEQLADTIGVLDEGKLIALGTLDELRRQVRYNYSVKLLSLPAPPITLTEGEMVKGQHDLPVILTTEDEAFRIAQNLSREGIKFTINPVGLTNTITSRMERGETTVFRSTTG